MTWSYFCTHIRLSDNGCSCVYWHHGSDRAAVWEEKEEEEEVLREFALCGRGDSASTNPRRVQLTRESKRVFAGSGSCVWSGAERRSGAAPGGSGGNHIWSKYSLLSPGGSPAINSAGGGVLQPLGCCRCYFIPELKVAEVSSVQILQLREKKLVLLPGIAFCFQPRPFVSCLKGRLRRVFIMSVLRKEMEKYRDIDEDELLKKLSEEELQRLEDELEELDPDNHCAQ
ncbi:hypothetical protein LDENG_00217070 [Lucifuga dentata]|nr:hypothetical protein LDENG_00217070 [Lucifuga dentata]